MKEPRKVSTISWDKWLWIFLHVAKKQGIQWMKERRDKGELLTRWNVTLNNGMYWKFSLSNLDYTYVGMWYACSGMLYVTEMPRQAFIAFYNRVAHNKPLPITPEELEKQSILPTPEDALLLDK